MKVKQLFRSTKSKKSAVKGKNSESKGYASNDYEGIRSECLDDGKYKDRKFPKSPNFVWKRPHEITPNPQFIVDGVSRFDVNQGELGDCWMLSAIANLTMNKQLFSRVVPCHQTFEKEKGYVGSFYFRFWHYGKWVEVVVDDRLPTDPENGELVYLSSQSRNEFWPALLEKAYAKLHGSYEALKGGWIGEAMVAFTGGIALRYLLQAPHCPTDLYGLVQRAHKRRSLIGCAILENHAAELHGLISGHAYSVTGLEEITINGQKKKVQLLRIRNPWGKGEWTGPWSDGSREWRSIDKDLQLKVQDDGEFWMSFEDFRTNFTHLEICHLNSALPRDDGHQDGCYWKEAHVAEGSWIRDDPQHHFTICESDVDERDLCAVIISLTQKDYRSKAKNEGLTVPSICFGIYEILPNSSIVASKPLSSSGYSQSSANLKVDLRPGEYCVLLSTDTPSTEGEFLLRIFTERRLRECRSNIAKSIRSNEPPMSLEDSYPSSRVNATESTSLNATPQDSHPSSRVTGTNRIEYGAGDLQEMLKIYDWEANGLIYFKDCDGFSLESCRSMVALRDDRRSGRLSCDQFESLRRDVSRWCEVFKKHKDVNNRMDSTQLSKALVSAEMGIDPVVLENLAQRYGEEASFEAFVLCCLRLQRFLQVWSKNDSN